MRFSRGTFFCLLTLALHASIFPGATYGAARKVVPEPIPLSAADASRLSSQLGGFSCGLGVTNSAFTSLNYIAPPDDQFYTLLEPSQCPACGGTNSARLSTAHVVLNFRTLCTVPIDYAIVTADTACAQPDPLGYICGPLTTNLTPTSIGLQDFQLPLPDSCMFTGRAFLKINFKSFPAACSLQTKTPLLVLATGGCPACRSYNYYDEQKEDLCREPASLGGQPIFYVDAWSCYTPTLPRSWGALKLRYR